MEQSATYYIWGKVICPSEESEATTSMGQLEKRSCETSF